MDERNMLLRALPQAERERLQPYLEYVTHETAEVLFEADQPIEYVWFPHDAVTSTLQLLRNGDTIEAGLMGLEGMAGIQLWLRQATTPCRTIVQVPGTASRMTKDVFIREVVRNPDSPLNDLLAAYVHGFLTLTSQTAACNRMHQVDQRLCRWLRMTYNRVPDRTAYPLRQEFLAAMLGVQRPTVSTAANILQRAGFIDYTRGRVRILDPSGLAQGACECLELMEKQFDRMFAEPWRPSEKSPAPVAMH